MRTKVITLLMLSIFSAGPGSEEERTSQSVQVGQTKQEIRTVLGEPQEKNINIRVERSIWGPEEEFWHKIPLNSEFEVWKYRNEEGNLNLYFIDDDDKLDYKGFSPNGVVYESVH